ncbi:DUF1588 domain-containing protein [Pseudobacteriovorax antillogorgiicola]|uniref:DUF1592 domain-containing protein n=1 Tax=Pseudobacteriovorax antillogorgiicola TaxID=1513793 RepID=A0A1Y6BKK2_9BACT|nr:DUF1588 domain-containing protein [Pseudobacteriovorax antillogorgiicola]TCS54690.1 uncharacterized protein DUF1585 [Pseudobacteriovorax antillogorgiicola]SMF16479.1 Protein of unknown function [Pseudobacteriovorax antillogorgiicola]
MIRPILFLGLIGMAGCSLSPDEPENSDLAQVTLNGLRGIDYDSSGILVKQDSQTVFQRDNIPKEESEIDVTLQPGSYAFQLDFKKGQDLIASSTYCSGEQQTFDLMAGQNDIRVFVCTADGKGVFTPSCNSEEESLGRRVLRRLTAREMQKSVNGIMGRNFPIQDLLPTESKDHGLDNSVTSLVVTDDHAKAYLAMAKTVAEEMTKQNSRFLKCQGGEACMNEFLTNWGELIWRKTLNSEERNSLLELYRQQTVAQGTWEKGFEAMAAAMFFAPEFLYRPEIGEESDGIAKLTNFELASELSFLIWGRGPDRELLGLAKQDKLDQATLVTQAERLLKSPDAKSQLGHFVATWLESDMVLSSNKDMNRWPNYNWEMRRDLDLETRDFFNHVSFETDGDFERLFLSPYTIATDRTNTIYKGTKDGEKIYYPEGERRGLLGHGSVLAAHSTFDETGPIHRGVFLLEKILCEEMPSPPDSLDIQPPPRDPNASTRERFAAHSDNPACAACHVKIDGAGFGFENFDAVGQFQTIDNGKTVDSTGVVKIDAVDHNYDGLYELSGKLASSLQAKLCFAKKVYTQSYGVHEEEQDKCAVETLQSKFLKHGNIKNVWLDLVSDKAFRHRR